MINLWVLLLLTVQVHSNKMDDDEDVICSIVFNASKEERCTAVIKDELDCEGGGYLKWTQYVECSKNTEVEIVLIFSAIVLLIYLLFVLSTCGNDYFSPNIAGIVAHLKLSESVAGVTLLAFGNGAPDVFGSVAAVLSSTTPKSDLALGQLLGGGLFVLTVVAGSIMWSKSFRIAVIPTVRDILFYTIGFSLMVSMFFVGVDITWFQPAAFLLLYILYVICVVLTDYYRKKRKNKIVQRRETVHYPKPKLGIVVKLPSKDSGCGTEIDETEDVTIVHRTVSVRNRHVDGSCSDIRNKPCSEYRKLLIALSPFSSSAEFKNLTIFGKATCIILAPAKLAFSLTIPCYENQWSKALSILHVFVSPQLALFAMKNSLNSISIFTNWQVALICSVLLFLVLMLFTSISNEPKYYKEFYSYFGFVMSVLWIYLIASEIVNIITMLAIHSGVSYEILGVTVMAWCNCIGDVFADLAVVKQGFPRMALAAAIGGPVFNLLIGFGLPFFITGVRGYRIPIKLTRTFIAMLTFLGLTLIVMLTGFCACKFQTRKILAIVLFSIYAVFVSCVVLLYFCNP